MPDRHFVRSDEHFGRSEGMNDVAMAADFSPLGQIFEEMAEVVKYRGEHPPCVLKESTQDV